MTPAPPLVFLLGLVAAGSTVAATLLVVRLHLLPTGVDAIQEGVSGYAVGRWGGLYRAQIVLCGISAGLIVVDVGILGIGSARSSLRSRSLCR